MDSGFSGLWKVQGQGIEGFRRITELGLRHFKFRARGFGLTV